jgi:hypothetical protein
MPLKRFCNVVRIDRNRDPARMVASAGAAHAWANRLQPCSLETSMDHEHDTVVVDSGGSSSGMILGIIAVVVLLIAVWYFALGPGAGGTSTNTTNNNNTINPPAATEQAPASP